MLKIGALVVAALAAAIGGWGFFTKWEADIVSACDLRWELKIAEENVKKQEKIDAANWRISTLEQQLREEAEKTEKESAEKRKAIEAQWHMVPLSEACNQCRIPRDHIWLRSNSTGNSDGDKSGARKVSPGGQKADGKSTKSRMSGSRG